MWSFGPTLNVDYATRSKIKRSRREFATVTLSEMGELSKKMEHLEWEISEIRVRVCHYEETARPKPCLAKSSTSCRDCPPRESVSTIPPREPNHRFGR